MLGPIRQTVRRWQQCCGWANRIAGEIILKRKWDQIFLWHFWVNWREQKRCGKWKAVFLLLFIGHTWVGGATLCSIYQVLVVNKSLHQSVSQLGNCLKWPAGSVLGRRTDRGKEEGNSARCTRHKAFSLETALALSLFTGNWSLFGQAGVQPGAHLSDICGG